MTTKQAWANRIIGHGVEAPDQLLANPRNWRIHPKAQQDALSGLLDSVGWVQDVIVNQRTGHVIDGHLRVSLALSREEPTMPVVYVDLSLEEEALVLASLDPLAAMAVTDQEMLAALLVDVNAEGALADMIERLTDDTASKAEYTQKIETPLYEPTGPKPALGHLFDDAKALSLVEEIDRADIPEDLRGFLVAAAGRHTVLHFDQIANYYAHSPADVQRLMEHSALVIIDADQAVEQGFLNLHNDISDAFHGDYPDA